MSAFSASIEKWRGAVREDLKQVAQKSIFKLAAKIVWDTPVDTGFLRGNWQPTFDEPAKPDDSTSIHSGAVAVGTASLLWSGLQLGQTVYFVNNTVYAMRIERGFIGQDSLGRTYNQSGQYFVKKNVENWQNIVSEAVAEVKNG